MDKKKKAASVAKQVTSDDAATDDSVEGHVNLQQQNTEEKPNKALRSLRRI